MLIASLSRRVSQARPASSSMVRPSRKDRFSLTALASLLAVACVPGGLLAPDAARAQRFDPNVSASATLGSFPTATGYYHFDTTPRKITGGRPPFTYTYTYVSVTGPNGYQRNGVLSNGCAVFAYDDIFITTGQHVTASGTLPLALVSRGTVSVWGGDIRVDGQSGQGNYPENDEGYYSLPGGLGGPGGGAGGASAQYTFSGSLTTSHFTATSGTGLGATYSGGLGSTGFISSGAGFGGVGGASRFTSVSNPYTQAGGSAYNSVPSNPVRGGSGAGGTEFASGGGGGGALEISAGGSIFIVADASGNVPISANGGNGASVSYPGYTANGGGAYSASGGGSGGLIYLAADYVYLWLPGNIAFGTWLSATGGADSAASGGGYSYLGGGGAGGRVRVEVSPANYASLSLASVGSGTRLQGGGYVGTPSKGGGGTLTIGTLAPATSW